MRIKQYLREVRAEDGKPHMEQITRDLRRLEFKPKFFLVIPRLTHDHDLFDEALNWLETEYPGVQYAWAYEGLDWYFSDDMVAMHFKLRFS